MFLLILSLSHHISLQTNKYSFQKVVYNTVIVIPRITYIPPCGILKEP